MVMSRLREKWEYSEFRACFNWANNENRGRTLLLINSLISTIGNVLISGVLYTGFLAANGIDIVRVGIITFIPYIAWAFSLFSPMILCRFKKRRGLCIFNTFFYYTCVVLATTIMPMFVEDPTEKTIWFGVFIFLGNVMNALVGSGASAWHVHFIPKDLNQRNYYIACSNLIVYVVNSAVALFSSVLADSLDGSPEVFTVLRIIAFVLFIATGLMLYLIPKEYPYPGTENRVKLTDVFTVPFKAKKFMMTILVVVAWNAFCNVNANTWTYYLQNTVHVSYFMLYICTQVCTIGAIFFQKKWREAIQRFGWFQMLTFVILATAVLEVPISFTTESTLGVYAVVSVLQGFLAVGTNLVFGNMFYVNLPKGNVDIYATFYNFVANIAAFVGSSLGTAFISWTTSLEEARGGPLSVFGLPFYGSQFLTWIKFACLAATGLYVWKMTPKMQPDGDTLI